MDFTGAVSVGGNSVGEVAEHDKFLFARTGNGAWCQLFVWKFWVNERQEM